MVRFRRAVLAAAFLPSTRPVARTSILRAVAASASAEMGTLFRATQPRTSATSSGGLVRCLVLYPHRTRARRMLASSGRPRASAIIAGVAAVSARAMSFRYIAGVAAVSARAMSFRYLAEASFHFMSTYAQANSYQVVSDLRRSPGGWPAGGQAERFASPGGGQ